MYPLEAPYTAKGTYSKVLAQGVSVMGFFLFTSHNDLVMRYMEMSGLTYLDTILRGSQLKRSQSNEWRCGLFVYEPVTTEWRDHAARDNHPWTRVFGHPTRPHPRQAPPLAPLPASGQLADARRILRAAPEEVVVEVNQSQYTTFDLRDPQWYWKYDRSAAIKLAYYLGKTDADLPSVVLFAGLSERKYWWFPLTHITTQEGIKSFLSRFFESSEFKAALDEVEQAHGQV